MTEPIQTHEVVDRADTQLERGALSLTGVVMMREIPLKRASRAEEVANVIAFLASDEASYVTGAVWACDGGMTAV